MALDGEPALSPSDLYGSVPDLGEEQGISEISRISNEEEGEEERDVRITNRSPLGISLISVAAAASRARGRSRYGTWVFAICQSIKSEFTLSFRTYSWPK